MSARPFRFGVALRHTGSGREWAAKAKLVEELGYDVLLVGDNPMTQAPLPALAAAAAVTSRVRLSTYVLNPAVRQPPLLIQELATVDQLSEGRLEIALGLGNRRADVPQPAVTGSRPEALERLISDLKAAFGAGESGGERFAQERPAIVVAGVGPRLVEIAAAEADTFLVSGQSPHPPQVTGPTLFDRETAEHSYGRVREVAGDRIELAAGIQVLAITNDRRAAAEEVHRSQPHLSVDQILESPKAAFGTVEEIARQLRERYEQLGISYLILAEPSMHDFLPVRELLGARLRRSPDRPCAPK